MKNGEQMKHMRNIDETMKKNNETYEKMNKRNKNIIMKLMSLIVF